MHDDPHLYFAPVPVARGKLGNRWLETVIVSEVDGRKARAALPAGSTRRKTEHVGMPGPESHKPHITLTPEGWAARIGFHSHRRVSDRDGDTVTSPSRFSYTRKCEGRSCKRTGAPPKLLRMTRSFGRRSRLVHVQSFTVIVVPVLSCVGESSVRRRIGGCGVKLQRLKG